MWVIIAILVSAVLVLLIIIALLIICVVKMKRQSRHPVPEKDSQMSSTMHNEIKLLSVIELGQVPSEAKMETTLTDEEDGQYDRLQFEQLWLCHPKIFMFYDPNRRLNQTNHQLVGEVLSAAPAAMLTMNKWNTMSQ